MKAIFIIVLLHLLLMVGPALFFVIGWKVSEAFGGLIKKLKEDE